MDNASNKRTLVVEREREGYQSELGEDRKGHCALIYKSPSTLVPNVDLMHPMLEVQGFKVTRQGRNPLINPPSKPRRHDSLLVKCALTASRMIPFARSRRWAQLCQTPSSA